MLWKNVFLDLIIKARLGISAPKPSLCRVGEIKGNVQSLLFLSMNRGMVSFLPVSPVFKDENFLLIKQCWGEKLARETDFWLPFTWKGKAQSLESSAPMTFHTTTPWSQRTQEEGRAEFLGPKESELCLPSKVHCVCLLFALWNLGGDQRISFKSSVLTLWLQVRTLV